MERSDAYTCYVSDHTGEIAAVNPKRNIFISPETDGPLKFEGNNSSNIRLQVQNFKSHSFSKVQIPYCVKLLIQECAGIGVSLKIVTDKKKDELLVVSDELDKSTEKKKKDDDTLISKK